MNAMGRSVIHSSFSVNPGALKPGEQGAFLLKDLTLENHVSQDDFDCPLCQSLLFNPVTTSCGHTFCKACILRGVEHDNRCPMCRGLIHVTPDIGVNVLTQALIQSQFPQAYAARKAEMEVELADELLTLPLFMLGSFVLFPGQQLPLHVFEPRYQAMMRRCLQSTKRFGVVPMNGQQLAPVGVCALIENCHWYPDGRCLLQTRGMQRFRMSDIWDAEGYRVAKVEYFDDLPPPEDQETIVRVELKRQQLLEAAVIHYGEMFAKFETKLGAAPRTDASAFSWWLGCVMNIPVQGKYVLLSLRTVESRLDFLANLLSVVHSGGNLNTLTFAT